MQQRSYGNKGIVLNYEISSLQVEVIEGSLLGDGHLSKTKIGRNGVATTNSRFCEQHSMAQLEWLTWKHDKLKPLSAKQPRKYEVPGRVKKNGKIVNDYCKTLSSCSFKTKVNVHLTNLEREWYLRNSDGQYILNDKRYRQKCIPKNFELSPMKLAIWYLDDGSLAKPSRGNSFVTLNSQSFSLDDCEFLKTCLQQMGLTASIHASRAIRVSAKNTQHFLSIVKSALSDLPDCMRYKLDAKYNEIWFAECGWYRYPKAKRYSVTYLKSRKKWWARLSNPFLHVGHFSNEMEATIAAKKAKNNREYWEGTKCKLK